MLKEALSQSAAGYDDYKYGEVGTVQLVVADIVEAIKAGNGGDYSLQEDKSGEFILCENTQKTIKPLLYIAVNGSVKLDGLRNGFHGQVALIEKIFDIRDSVKLPVMDTTSYIPFKPA